jgi:metal-responsive CopG/Arc/MetJ family transcriptional regulator
LPKTKNVTICLLPEFLKEVNRIAGEDNRSRSEVIQEAVGRFIQEHEAAKSREEFRRRLHEIWAKSGPENIS